MDQYHLATFTSVETLYNNKEQTCGEVILDHVIQYLRHSSSNLAEAVADGLNVNQRHLSGAVQLLTGLTLQRFIKEWRLLQAKDLLADASLTPDQVAQRCGYYNTENFSSEFARKFGTTPYIYQTGTARRNGNYKMNEDVSKRRAMIEKARELKEN